MILNVYKPKGWTSFDVVAKIKKQQNNQKVGHAGTLDPLAEGVLIILTDKDTKRQDDFMKLEKEYETDITFGITSVTDDLELIPHFISSPKLSDIKNKLQEIISKYVGKINQTIPNYSAKKIAGKPMYKWMRGDPQKLNELLETVPMVKKVEVKSITVLNVFEQAFSTDAGEKILPTVSAKIVCSHGTFIRALARDFGHDMGTSAVMTRLVRTRIGEFLVENAESDISTVLF
jgi:tRNA pseudouridine55 synthase